MSCEARDWSRQLGRLLVISPHLDDAVFGCADLLASHPGSTVVTVFAGSPGGARPVTAWDRLSGFASAPEAISARRREDRAALSLLGARPSWLEFLDAQYGRRPEARTVADALAAQIEASRATTVLFPLGLFHDDHRLVSEASLEVCARAAATRWIVYADALYRSLGELHEARMRELLDRGWSLERLGAPACSVNKPRAVACYASQLRALGTPGHVPIGQAFAPEQYWRVRAGA